MKNDPHAFDLRLPIDYVRRIDSAARRENVDCSTWLHALIEKALAASGRAHQGSIEDAAWLAFVSPSAGDSLGDPLGRARSGGRSEPDGHPGPELTCPSCGELPHLFRCDYCASGYVHEVGDRFICCQCGVELCIDRDRGGIAGSDASIEEALDQAAYEDWRQYGDPTDGDLL